MCVCACVCVSIIHFVVYARPTFTICYGMDVCMYVCECVIVPSYPLPVGRRSIAEEDLDQGLIQRAGKYE